MKWYMIIFTRGAGGKVICHKYMATVFLHTTSRRNTNDFAAVVYKASEMNCSRTLGCCPEAMYVAQGA